MLDMPRLIQEWKQVSFILCGMWMGANQCAERSWTWVDEVAQWEGEEIGWLKGLGVFLRCVNLCVRMVQHILMAFGQVNPLLCIILAGGHVRAEMEPCNNITRLIIYSD